LKPKNIVLLGFVNKAVEYLDEHMDEETPDYKLSKLKNIDLVALEDELNKNLSSSLGSMQSTMTSLLKAGNEAFNDFLDSHKEASDLTQELNDILDVDLDSKQVVKKDDKQELQDLLSFYNLEDRFDFSTEEDDSEIEEALEDRQMEEEIVLSEEEKMLQQIAESANDIKDDDKAGYSEIYNDLQEKQNTELDDIFNQIVDHEKNPDVKVQITADEVNRLFKEQIIKVDKQQSKSETKPAQVLDSVSKPDIVENPGVDSQAEESKQADAPAEAKPYVNSLIEDLKQQMAREEEAQRVKDETNKEVYDRILETYPYLPISFIKNVYDLKDSINLDYQYCKNIVVLHRVNFATIDELQQFAEIVLQHGYQINADEKQKIVDCFIQLKNKEGKIIANIFTVANQASLLHGEYEGYRVIEVL